MIRMEESIWLKLVKIQVVIDRIIILHITIISDDSIDLFRSLITK